MNKVVLKHHEKELKMKKKAKDSKETRQYELGKRHEEAVNLKTRI